MCNKYKCRVYVLYDMIIILIIHARMYYSKPIILGRFMALP